jgi:ATP-binding cassette subfamily B protein
VFESALVLDKVNFRYTDDGPLVLRDVSLTIPRGSRVGFVGKTGSGKSTLVDLILGLLSPTSGEIRIDDEMLRPANTRMWQAKIAHVPQHIYLSDATIIENIAFGVARPAIVEARAYLAARNANVDSFITEQPKGYDALVGERGVRLSGGQRQRIGIARALYKPAAVLVLDEATSALDDATEASVMAAIHALGRDLTVLMIAHRVTTLRDCDIIFRVENGEIVASGSYAEVIGERDVQRQGAS